MRFFKFLGDLLFGSNDLVTAEPVAKPTSNELSVEELATIQAQTKIRKAASAEKERVAATKMLFDSIRKAAIRGDKCVYWGPTYYPASKSGKDVDYNDEFFEKLAVPFRERGWLVEYTSSDSRSLLQNTIMMKIIFEKTPH